MWNALVRVAEAVAGAHSADRSLRWYVTDVWGQLDRDHTRPGAPLRWR